MLLNSYRITCSCPLTQIKPHSEKQHFHDTIKKTQFLQPQVDIAKNQMQNVTVQTAELQHYTQIHSLINSNTEVMTREKWDPEAWNGNMWSKQNEKDNFKSPAEVTYHPVTKNNSLPLLENLSYPYVKQMICRRMFLLLKTNHNHPCCHQTYKSIVMGQPHTYDLRGNSLHIQKCQGFANR